MIRFQKFILSLLGATASRSTFTIMKAEKLGYYPAVILIGWILDMHIILDAAKTSTQKSVRLFCNNELENFDIACRILCHREIAQLHFRIKS